MEVTSDYAGTMYTSMYMYVHAAMLLVLAMARNLTLSTLLVGTLQKNICNIETPTFEFCSPNKHVQSCILTFL